MPSETAAAVSVASRVRSIENVPQQAADACGAVLTTPAAAHELSLPASGFAIGFVPAEPVATRVRSIEKLLHMSSRHLPLVS